MSCDFLRLDAPDCSLVVMVEAGLPAILHYGPSLPADEDLASLAAARRRPLAHAALDADPPIALLPEIGGYFAGVPGLSLHRAGRDWVTNLLVVRHAREESELRFELADPVAGVEAAIALRLDPGCGVLTSRIRVTNTGGAPLELLALASLVLPVPARCGELIASGGRWCREFQLERAGLPARAYLAENRTGRTSHANVPALTLCEPGCTETAGFALSASVAWSGNHRLLVDGLPDGRRVLQQGPLFLPGEVLLAPGASYEAPPAHACLSETGLNGLRVRWHGFVRAQVLRPLRGPRKVHLNTWEAVYFDHDMDRLRALVDAASGLGVERFVLDDGWFLNRSDDRRALGDWRPDPLKYPDGLAPLIAHVRSRGMEFGLWVEPEMVNPDSELFRAHPDWALQVAGVPLLTGRHQLVLDLVRPEVFDHLLTTLDGLLATHDIGYLKWDMNRDLTAPGHDGAAAVDAQVRALYRLLDALRARHPAVEIESCASGGGRPDLGILARTDRVWTSDCNDALERIAMHRGFGLYLPPEIMGAHIGPAPAHTTGRRLDFGFQAAVAMFGHLGLELDAAALGEADAAVLRHWIGQYKRFRALLHGGQAFELPSEDPGIAAHGVLAADGGEALVLCARVATSIFLIPPPQRIPGLHRQERYRVRLLEVAGEHARTTRAGTPFLQGEPVILSGAALAESGVQLPGLIPASAALIHLERLEPAR